MEVRITVPHGTDISIIESEYPDIYQDDRDIDGEDIYFIGEPPSDDEDDGNDWLTYNEAIECCGFAEGAVTEAIALIEGNGEWAQGMLRRKNFSGFAATDEDKKRWKCNSELWHSAFERGEMLRIAV